MPPVLVKALLRYWFRPDFALAFARVALAEAEATACPLRVREWRRAVVWLEWIAGRPEEDHKLPSEAEIEAVREEQEQNRRLRGPIEKIASKLGLELDEEEIP
jgi:hypothetical protein